MSATPAHPLVGRGILAVWNNRDATIAAEYERGTSVSIYPSGWASMASTGGAATRR